MSGHSALILSLLSTLSLSAVNLSTLSLSTVNLSTLGSDSAQLTARAPWVVIVAGSSGYQNYRHQADACHAYQAMITNGVPAAQIITMVFDDVAKNEGNPFPGKLFNTVDGADVYAGCTIDYSGSEVTKEHFFLVLHGNKTGPARVLESTRDDDVFIVYTDHGAPGYVTFPAGVAMHALDLSDALVTMQARGCYGRLLLYVDACNSGSLFDGGLLKAPNALAVAAASAQEESYAAFCPPYDKVHAEGDREAFSCLGDVFSINWIVAATSGGGGTVGAQVALVANETANGQTLNPHHNSHVQVYGDNSIRAAPARSFQGAPAAAAALTAAAAAEAAARAVKAVRTVSSADRVSSRDVPLALAMARVAAAPTAEARHALAAVREARSRADMRFAALARTCMPAEVVEASSGRSPTSTEWAVPPRFLADRAVVTCYKAALHTTAVWWGVMDSYSLRHSGLLAVLCGELGPDAATACIADHMRAPDEVTPGGSTVPRQANALGQAQGRQGQLGQGQLGQGQLGQGQGRPAAAADVAAVSLRLVHAINDPFRNATWVAAPPSRFDGWTLAQVARLCGALPNDAAEARAHRIPPPPAAAAGGAPAPAIPSDFDGRAAFPACAATIGHVRDQTDCGGCWAFASTEAFNDRRCIATGDTRLLSVQDTGACCSGATCMYSNGCVGGQITGAWQFFVSIGVVSGGDQADVNKTDTCMPFTLPVCTHNASRVQPRTPLCPPGEYTMPACSSVCGNAGYPTPYAADKVRAKSMITIGHYPPSLVQTELMAHGPVSTLITVFEDFLHYSSGVYKHLEGSEVGSHAVEVVGWGVEAGEPYWLVKNSWGSSWGLGGFVKIGNGEIGIENSWTAGYV